MIRSANGCLEPVKFTRLSNHFQTQEGRAAEGLGALAGGEMLYGGWRQRDGWPLSAFGAFWQFERILLDFVIIKGLYDSLTRPVIQR